MRLIRWIGGLGHAVIGLGLCGCDPAVEQSEARSAELVGMYVGDVEGSDMMIGAAVEGDKIRIYTCGGPDELASSKWFKGSVADGPFELVNGDWSIHGAWVDGRLEGELHPPVGEARPWSAEPAEPGTGAGLYAATTGACTSGVVVQHAGDGGPPVAQGTYCDGAGNFAQIIILSPFAATPRGILVAARVPRAASQFYVTPVVP